MIHAVAVRRVAAPVIVALASALAVPAAHAAWSRPFFLAGAGHNDVSPPVLAVSASGAAAFSFGLGSEDVPGSAQANLAQRSSRGRLARAHELSGVSQVLALAYRGSSLRLLTGSTSAGEDCCSATATATVAASGGLGRAHPLVSGLAGATEGRLLALAGGRMVAVIATERGVWSSQSPSDGTLGPARLISGRSEEPVAMDAAWLGGDRSLVAWTSGTGVAGSISPRTIQVASGTVKAGPGGRSSAIAVPRGHRVDEISVVRHGSGATLAWIESWSDRHGFHSRVEIADLGHGRPRTRALSPADRLASGLSAAGDPAGDEGVAWSSCTTADSCTVQAAGRGAGHGFGSARTLGGADATAQPSLAISPSGQILVGWVDGGHPVASVGFGGPVRLSAATGAADVAVAYGTRRAALAAWSQGTLVPSVDAAAYAAG